MRSIRSSLLFVFLLAAGLPGHAQQPADAPPPADETAAELEQLVDTLKDEEARQRLIADLESLLEARRAQQAEAEAPLKASDTLEIAKDFVLGLWDRVTSIDPQQVLISTLVTFAVLFGAVLLRWLIVVLLRRLYARLARGADDETEATGSASEADSKKAELPGSVTRLITLIIGVIALALIAESWGGGLSDLLRTDIGARLAETALAIGLILVMTVALWNAAELLIDRVLRLATRKHDRDRTARRLDTLVPLLTKALQGTIGVMAALLILSELGINIGPLLAGAGILGLAVGFGAQTLVKDLITGVTTLLEDSATVGDVIEVAGHTGVVEEMRIRIVQLRDISGNVHLVPYSEVTSIKNFTKDFSYYLFDIGVAYREDTDEVCKLLLEISEEMQKDEKYGENILEGLEILGLDRFGDSAVVIRARVKTEPGLQWQTGREFNRRIKKRFDEAGIEIPFPHTTVYFGEPKEGRPPAMQLALADGAAEQLAGKGE